MALPSIMSAHRVQAHLGLTSRDFCHRCTVGFANQLATLFVNHGYRIPVHKQMESKGRVLFDFMTYHFESVSRSRAKSLEEGKGDYWFSSIGVATNVPLALALVFFLVNSEDIPLEFHWNDNNMKVFLEKSKKRSPVTDDLQATVNSMDWKNDWLPHVIWTTPASEEETLLTEEPTTDCFSSAGGKLWPIDNFIEMLLAVYDEEPLPEALALWKMLEQKDSFLLDSGDKFFKVVDAKMQKSAKASFVVSPHLTTSELHRIIGKDNSKEAQHDRLYCTAVEHVSKAAHCISHYTAAGASSSLDMYNFETLLKPAKKSRMNGTKERRKKPRTKRKLAMGEVDEEAQEEEDEEEDEGEKNLLPPEIEIGRAFSFALAGYLADQYMNEASERQTKGESIDPDSTRAAMMCKIGLKEAFEDVAGCRISEGVEENFGGEDGKRELVLAPQRGNLAIVCPHQRKDERTKDEEIMELRSRCGALERRQAMAVRLEMDNDEKNSLAEESAATTQTAKLQFEKKQLQARLNEAQQEIRELKQQVAAHEQKNGQGQQPGALRSPFAQNIKGALCQFDLSEHRFVQEMFRLLFKEGHNLFDLLNEFAQGNPKAQRPEFINLYREGVYGAISPLGRDATCQMKSPIKGWKMDSGCVDELNESCRDDDNLGFVDKLNESCKDDDNNGFSGFHNDSGEEASNQEENKQSKTSSSSVSNSSSVSTSSSSDSSSGSHLSSGSPGKETEMPRRKVKEAKAGKKKRHILEILRVQAKKKGKVDPAIFVVADNKDDEPSRETIVEREESKLPLQLASQSQVTIVKNMDDPSVASIDGFSNLDAEFSQPDGEFSPTCGQSMSPDDKGPLLDTREGTTAIKPPAQPNAHPATCKLDGDQLKDSLGLEKKGRLGPPTLSRGEDSTTQKKRQRQQPSSTKNGQQLKKTKQHSDNAGRGTFVHLSEVGNKAGKDAPVSSNKNLLLNDSDSDSDLKSTASGEGMVGQSPKGTAGNGEGGMSPQRRTSGMVNFLRVSNIHKQVVPYFPTKKVKKMKKMPNNTPETTPKSKGLAAPKPEKTPARNGSATSETTTVVRIPADVPLLGTTTVCVCVASCHVCLDVNLIVVCVLLWLLPTSLRVIVISAPRWQLGGKWQQTSEYGFLEVCCGSA